MVASTEHVRHRLLRPDLIEARLYQQTILNTCSKHNSLVIMPTALGKTICSLFVALTRLDKYDWCKILVLAPTVPLVFQHLVSFRNLTTVDKNEFVILTGKTPPWKRRVDWNSCQFVFATPQTIRNDIEKESYDLSEVGLVVFDEAHHARKKYAYGKIAEKYVKQCSDPLILGLTASPGNTREKIEELCKTLFIERVELRTEDDPDVAPYVNPISVKWRHVDLPEEYARAEELLRSMLLYELGLLRRCGASWKKKDSSITKMDLLRLGERIRQRITEGDQSARQAASLQAGALSLTHAIELLTTQDASVLRNFLEKIKEKAARRETKAAVRLAADDRFDTVLSLISSPAVDHPKLEKMKDLVRGEFKKDTNSRVIVFTQYRDTAKRILKELEGLEGIQPVRFIGQAHKEGDRGLNQKEQKEILRRFNEGDFNVLVSTSIAEEGMDITSVKRVIFYEPVPSEIRLIQRRGRTGRKEAGLVDILITSKTRDEAAHWTSLRRQESMRRIIGSLPSKLDAGIKREPISVPEPGIALKKPLEKKEEKLEPPKRVGKPALEKKKEMEKPEPKKKVEQVPREPLKRVQEKAPEHKEKPPEEAQAPGEKKPDVPTPRVPTIQVQSTKGMYKAVQWVVKHMQKMGECTLEELEEAAEEQDIPSDRALAAVTKLVNESVLYQPSSERISVV